MTPYLKSIETHARAFFKVIIFSIGSVCSVIIQVFVFYFQVEHVNKVLPDENGGILVTCIAATSGIGRMIFGKVADLPNINRILLQQISFVSIGLCTMLLTAAPFFTGFEWASMIISALCLGKDLFRNGRKASTNSFYKITTQGGPSLERTPEAL